MVYALCALVLPYFTGHLLRLLRDADAIGYPDLLFQSLLQNVFAVAKNVGFGHWLSVAAKRTKSSRTVWFTFGLLVGPVAVVLYYVLVLCGHASGWPEARSERIPNKRPAGNTGQ